MLDVLPEVKDPRSAPVELLRGGHDDFAAAGERVLPPYTCLLYTSVVTVEFGCSGDTKALAKA